jgi:hypothetical protein
MTGTEDARNVEFYNKIKFWIFDASNWLFYTKASSKSTQTKRSSKESVRFRTRISYRMKNRYTKLSATDIANYCVCYRIFQKKMCSEITSSHHREATVKFLIIWQGEFRNTSCFTEQRFEHMLSWNLHLVLNGDYLNFIQTKNLFYFTSQGFLKNFI